MRLEDQVCSLELAKRLNELGVNQKSAFYWCDKELQIKTTLGYSSWGCEGSTGAPDVVMDEEYDEYWDEPAIAAFTVAELGEILPEAIQTWKLPFNGKIKWMCQGQLDWQPGEIIESETEANCRAKMLIYLIEQGIVKP